QRQPHRPHCQVQSAAPDQRGAGRAGPLSGSGHVRPVSRAGWASLVLLGLMATLAVQGGEFTTWNYFELKKRVARVKAQEAELTRRVDSLGQVERAVLTDPAEQEQIAREQFGMIRPGEYLYKVIEPAEP